MTKGLKPETVEPLHSPERGKMRVFGLFSGGASALVYLLDGKKGEGPKGGERSYKLVGALTDTPGAEGIEKLQERGLPVEELDKAPFFPAEGRTEEARNRYFERVLEKVEPFDPDLILLSGFMQIVTEPLLSQFEDALLNVHPADLRIEESGERKFRGTDAVYDAVKGGVGETRSTAHLVTAEVDGGPIVTLSRSFPVQKGLVRTLQRKAPNKLRSYVEALQEWMKWEGDGPAVDRALDLIGSGSVGRGRGSEKGLLLREEGGNFIRGYFDLEEGRVKGI